MNFLVDSDVIIDFLNGKNQAGDPFKDTVKGNRLFMSVISWAEVVYGFKKMAIPSKTALFQDFLEEFKIKVIPLDEKVAEVYLDAKIELERRNLTLADFDLLIAATALTNKHILVTRNKKHFSRIKNLQIAI